VKFKRGCPQWGKYGLDRLKLATRCLTISRKRCKIFTYLLLKGQLGTGMQLQLDGVLCGTPTTQLEVLGYMCICLCGRPKVTSGESNWTSGASPPQTDDDDET